MFNPKVLPQIISYQIPKVQKVMLQPINVIFRLLQSRARVTIWVRELVHKRFEGIIVGFDEYMNIVLEDALEMNLRTHFKCKLGKILLRGDSIVLIQSMNAEGNVPDPTIISDSEYKAPMKDDITSHHAQNS